jgi:transcriptional regulator with XRE-family HTH domain
MSYIEEFIEKSRRESSVFRVAYDEEVQIAAEEKERRVALMKAMTQFRKAAKISQQQLAQAMQISQARVSQLEKGAETLSVDHLLEMLHLLGGKLAIFTTEEVKKHGLESKVIGPNPTEPVNKPVKTASRSSSKSGMPPTFISVSESKSSYQGKLSRKPPANKKHG